MSSSVENFSYAAPGDPRLKRLVIRGIERLTGQPRLKRMYEDFQKNPLPGETFWAGAVRQLALRLEVDHAALEAVPRSGPLMVVANHPFGVLDGIIISYLMDRVRPDFRILTNAVLNRAPEVRPWLLPIDFAPGREALATNLASRARARDHLVAGGCLIVFPAGGISTSRHPLHGPAIDAPWGTFAAGMIHQAKSAVLPVFFAGQNSRLFQIASHMSLTFRLSLIFKEVHDRIGSVMPVRIGGVLPYDDLAPLKDRRALMSRLRNAAYALSGDHRLIAAPPVATKAVMGDT